MQTKVASTERPAGTDARLVRLSAYVDLALDDVIDLLAPPSADALLAQAMRSALDTTENGVLLRAAEPERLAAGTARVAVRWDATSRAPRLGEGLASIHLLAVQTGRAPKTELLVTFAVDDDLAGPVASTLRRFLDALSHRLTHPEPLAAAPRAG